jgi:hypothetical protein
MGRSLSWLVIDSPDADGIAAELGVKRTGKSGAIPDFGLMAHPLADGRVLLVSNHVDEPLFSGKRLALLSKRGRLVTAKMEEHVMFSSCAAWDGGRKCWSVTHDSEKEPRHLAVTGKVPKELAPLKQAALEAQDLEDKTDAEVDHVFDVPLQVARAQTGLDVEQDFGVPQDSFQELNVGFWKRAWRATFLWRWILGFFGGLYLLGWIARKLGWQ